MGNNNIGAKMDAIRQDLVDRGFFLPAAFHRDPSTALEGDPLGPKIRNALQAAESSREALRQIAGFLTDRVIAPAQALKTKTWEPHELDGARDFLEALLAATNEIRREKEFVSVHSDLLSLYILALYRSGSPGRESPIIRMMLRNIARRKAIELDQSRLDASIRKLERRLTVAIICKRYATYVLVTRGLAVLFRSEIEFRLFGTSPEELALQIINLLVKHGVRLADVSDIVCVGGDLGALPDGIYVLTEKVKDESLRRLHNSSLNRSALVAWELRELLRFQGRRKRINASLSSPLSFSTLGSHDTSLFYVEGSRELTRHLRGHVKVTPLKAMASLISELEGINQQSLNLLVMSLDELFASVARKIGPAIIREMAAQEANRALMDFDFGKIVDRLREEGFVIPPAFRLASREIGTGVKEVCELIMIVESGKISTPLAHSLMHVVDSYARHVDMVLAMASSGRPHERPDYIVITSMMALDPHFQTLFHKIKDMIDNPFAPVFCMHSLEHEYLIANHLFELYVNPAQGDRRLQFSVEARSMRQALQVLGAARGGAHTFSFSALLDDVKSAIEAGSSKPADIVVVGADNEDALVAVANAKEHGLLDRVALIGDPAEIALAIDRCKVPLLPGTNPEVEIVPIDPLAVDYEDKKQSMATVFHQFLRENPEFVVMKGSVDTGKLLHEALAVYKSEPAAQDQPPKKRLASHTALFVLPDGRFFALSDAGVNPGFRNADALVVAIENQLDVLRRVVNPNHVLKVAIITAVEKETAAIPSTLLAAEAETKAKGLEARYGPLVVEGPLSFDLATVPEVAEEKRYQGQIRGDANCLVATDINTANVLYKMLSKTMGSLGLLVDNGGIITAGPGTVPIVLTSRGDTAQTKLNSILLALAYAAKAKQAPTAAAVTAA